MASLIAMAAGGDPDKIARAIGAEDVAHVLPARSLELFVAGDAKFATLQPLVTV